MKFAIKAAIAGSVLLGTAAQAQNVNPNDLILFVTNATNTSFYIQDLGVTMESVLSTAQITAGANVATKTSNGSFVVGGSLAGTQPNLSSFITANPGSSWTILGSETPGGGNSAGNKSFFATFVDNVGLLLNQPGETSSAIGGVAASSGIQGFNAELNTLIYSNNVNAIEGWGGGGNYGANASITYNFNVINGALVGTAQNLYVFSTNKVGSTDNPIEFVSQNKLTLNTDGSLTVAPVPLPAAVWLFGSGLLGLAGIGRRRLAA